ncbi:unknown protein [Seminavis robusta]|uniref:Uncharacterized protein n=1 Tax=Seminavis robusta TaxID=568900 RepID=A0A9N8EGG9_9STRA|nr:unknown protein [Seminavis robusta]|eukprot:Sro957_g224590.1 n/a (180) ;mRNA; f:40370-40909
MRDAKLLRNKRKYEIQKESHKNAKIEVAKKSGCYKPGMNMDLVTVAQLREGAVPAAALPTNDNTQANGNDNGDGKPKAKKRRINYGKMWCPYCGKKGHVSKASKKCIADLASPQKYNKADGSELVVVTPGGVSASTPIAAATPPPSSATNSDAVEVGLWDQLPLESANSDEEEVTNNAI